MSANCRHWLRLDRLCVDRLPDTNVPEQKPTFPPLPGEPKKETYGTLKPIGLYDDAVGG
jgi:hypothetical protein